MSITDAGIVLRAPGATARLAGSDIMLDSGGSTTVQAGTSFDLVTGTGLSLASGGNTTLQTAHPDPVIRLLLTRCEERRGPAAVWRLRRR